MRRAAEACVTAALAALAAALVYPAAAQFAEPPRAPRILAIPPGAVAPPAEPAAAPTAAPMPAALLGVRRPPNAARLAPLPEQRRNDEEPEEIVVIGQGWRLPDLGSEWRARQEEAANEGRFSVTVLPLYDPSEPPLHTDAFAAPEQRRHGYIELFRLRFGRRSRD
jgi:hypothetical protein